MPAGPLGSHNCDTPTSLVHSTLNAMNIEKPRFSLFTGDVIEGMFMLAFLSPLGLFNETTFSCDMAR